VSATAEELADRLRLARTMREERKAEELERTRTWTCGRRKAPCAIRVTVYVSLIEASHLCRKEETPLRQESGKP
jgi:hypothetical protein